MNWQEVYTDQCLRDLPFKVELNYWEQIEMIPTLNVHGVIKAELAHLLPQYLNHQGKVAFNIAVQVQDQVQVADIAVWFSKIQFQQQLQKDACDVAPDICLELLTEENPLVLLQEERMPRYFAAGAKEIWLITESGELSFYNENQEVKSSELIAEFPKKIDFENF